MVIIMFEQSDTTKYITDVHDKVLRHHPFLCYFGHFSDVILEHSLMPLFSPMHDVFRTLILCALSNMRHSSIRNERNQRRKTGDKNVQLQKMWLTLTIPIFQKIIRHWNKNPDFYERRWEGECIPFCNVIFMFPRTLYSCQEPIILALHPSSYSYWLVLQKGPSEGS